MKNWCTNLNRKNNSSRCGYRRQPIWRIFDAVGIVAVAVFFAATTVFAQSRDDRSRSSEQTQPGSTSQVVGGTESSGYPWMTAVLETAISDTYLAQICGGTLIASRWVMTAAHCLAPATSPSSIRPADRFDVLVGQKTLGGSSSQRVAVRNIYVHPDYKEYTYPDIALLELDETISAEPLRMALPAGRYDVAGTMATVAGWGWQSETGPSSQQLLEVSLPITTQSYCERAYRPREKIVRSAMVCAGTADGGVDACDGDSGGPLFVKDPQTNFDWLVGIVSFGEGCARANKPGVYTRVAPFTMWARAIMRNRLPSTSGENRLAAEFSVSCNRLRCVVDADPSTEGADQITHYRWSTGDSNIEFGRRIIHDYREPGEYRVKLEITDANGRRKSVTKRIQVVSDRPQYHRVSRVWNKRVVRPGKSVVVPNRYGFYAQAGKVFGLLESDAPNFDLLLQFYNQQTGQWRGVARSRGPDSNEIISYNATESGYYRWRILAKRGRGLFRLQTKFD